jgi:hypothetical protein
VPVVFLPQRKTVSETQFEGGNNVDH